jgi:hypothetical protein
MMVNEWTIKIASKYNELESNFILHSPPNRLIALDVQEASLRNRVNELNENIVQLSVSQQELTSSIANANQ